MVIIPFLKFRSQSFFICKGMNRFSAYFVLEKMEKKSDFGEKGKKTSDIWGLLIDHKYIFQHEKCGAIYTLINDLIYILLCFSPVSNNSHSLIYFLWCTVICCQIAFKCVHWKKMNNVNLANFLLSHYLPLSSAIQRHRDAALGKYSRWF